MAEIKTQRKTIQLGKVFLPYQAARIYDDSRFALDEKARRIGLDWTYAYRYTKKRALVSGRTYHTANDKASSLEFIGYVTWFAKLLNAGFEPVREEVINETEGILAQVCKFTRGGEIIATSSNPLSLHGKGGDVLITEYAMAKQPFLLWEAAQAVTQWGDDLRLWSTHTSVESAFNQHVKNARRLYEEAGKREIPTDATDERFRKLARELKVPAWSWRRTTIHDAVADGLVEKINGKAGYAVYDSREAFVEECRAKCLTEDQWKRQYLCEPSSDSTAMLPYHLLMTCVEDKCLADLLDAKNDLFQGGDIGRHNHPTVLATGEKVGDVLWLRRLERLVKMPFCEQLAIASRTITLPQFRRGCYDKTGMGEMPIEELQRQHGEYRIEGLKFTAEIKHELAIGLRRAFEDRAIRIPNDSALLDKLNSVKANYGTANIPRYEAVADDEEHGDEFWALAQLVRSATSGGFSGSLDPNHAATVGLRRGTLARTIW